MTPEQRAKLLSELSEAQTVAAENPTGGTWGVTAKEDRLEVYLALCTKFPEIGGMPTMTKEQKATFLAKRTGTEWDCRFKPKGGSTIAVTSYSKGKVMFLNLPKEEQEEVFAMAGVVPEWFEAFGG